MVSPLSLTTSPSLNDGLYQRWFVKYYCRYAAGYVIPTLVRGLHDSFRLGKYVPTLVWSGALDDDLKPPTESTRLEGSAEASEIRVDIGEVQHLGVGVSTLGITTDNKLNPIYRTN